METLNTAWQAASQDIYNAQQAGGEAGQPQGQPTEESSSDKGDDGEVTDVDFEEVK
jgi:molecular chaperone DnaK